MFPWGLHNANKFYTLKSTHNCIFQDRFSPSVWHFLLIFADVSFSYVQVFLRVK